MSERPILLDTCALIWIVSGEPLEPEAEATLQAAQQDETDIFISPMTTWEIGQLVARGRLVLSVPPLLWIETAFNAGVRLAGLTPEILIDSSFLPGPPLRDPADRIIAATARRMGYRLMTRDRPLLAFGRDGHTAVIPC